VAEAVCFLGGSNIILHIIYVDLTAEARVRYWASPLRFVVDKVALSHLFSEHWSTLISPLILLSSEGQAGED
jgi:hypothetical protein